MKRERPTIAAPLFLLLFVILVAGPAGNRSVSFGFLLLLSDTADTPPPTISAVAASSITSSSATISWKTNEASDSQVDYGTTTAYGTSTPLNKNKVTSHSEKLSGLGASTLYHYRVKSRDAAGNLAVSGDFTFITAPPPDTTPPVISNVSAGSLTSFGAVITWTTSEVSDSQVEYGTTTAYGNSTPPDKTLVSSHSVLLSQLTASTLYHYRVKSKDAAGNKAVSSDSTFTTVASLTVTTTSLPNGQVQVSYSATLAASGGTTPYSWSVTSGALPGGLTLIASTGAISGTPTAAGTFSFTIQVRDSASSPQTASKSLSITAMPPALGITTTSLPGGTVGISYSASLSASGGVPPYTWAVLAGQLPDGLSLTSYTGIISGTPTRAGAFSFTIEVHDSVGASTLASFTIGIGSTPPPGTILWSADHETGSLSQWYYPSSGPFGDYGGGESNSGIASSIASSEVAHSGNYSAKLTITTPNTPDSGVRLFRWAEPRSYAQLYYSVWYYFPQGYSAPNWWNVLQWKSQTQTTNDPFFVLNVGNRLDGTMFFYLHDWQRKVSYGQMGVNIPVGKWVHVEAFYQCAGDATGRVTIWQDGLPLFDIQNVPTRYADGDCEWSVNNYSDSLAPNTATIYIDDAAISTGRV